MPTYKRACVYGSASLEVFLDVLCIKRSVETMVEIITFLNLLFISVCLGEMTTWLHSVDY